MKKNSIYFILLFLTLISLYSNYRTFKVNVNQEKILQIISTGDYEFDNDYRDRISSGYPSVSSTVIPFKSILGAHWIVRDSIDKGLELLKQGQKDNPYLGFTDMIYASLFESVGMTDSFAFYARRAFSKLPNAPSHYVLLSKVFIMEEKFDSLEIVFDKIKDRVNDYQIWQLYLSSAIKNREKFDSLTLIDNAKIAKLKYNHHEEIRLLADYMIYGEDNINQQVILKKQAIDSFSTNPVYSIKIMKDILEQNGNIFNYETLIEMYFRNNEYSKVISLYDEMIILEMTDLKAVIIEFIAISYINTNNIQYGCYLAKQLDQANYNLSSSIAQVCNIG